MKLISAPGPLVLSTWKFGQIANAAAWAILNAGGSALDAVEAGCRAVEEDTTVTSVGLGGFPDASGQVSLDALIMESPDRCGAVAGLQDYFPAISVARRVMEKTPHILLVGAGAAAFAEAEGFRKCSLLTERAIQAWESWKRERFSATVPAHPAESAASEGPHDTIGVLALDGTGRLAGGCSTSGLAFKLPGRVGDSPLVGHGLYVDPEVGGAVATGHGELIMRICGTFLIVEEMRRGASPYDAIHTALKRIRDRCHPKSGEQAAFIAVRSDGQWAAGSLREGFQVAVTSAAQNALLEPRLVLDWGS